MHGSNGSVKSTEPIVDSQESLSAVWGLEFIRPASQYLILVPISWLEQNAN